MFHIFVYEHCFTISLVRNLESNVLTYLNKYGKERIGKAPHIAEYAWLNVMYPCVTETEVCDLEKRLGVAIPKVYKDFLMNVSNGFDIMNCTLALHGCRTSYDRSDLDSWYLLGTYEYDGSKLYLNTLDDKIYYCDRYDATPLKSWDSLSAMLTSEIERIFGLFDADGHCIDEDVPTTPVVI